MQMGFAELPLTPVFPCSLAGYAVAREACCVHDDLFVRSLAFYDDTMPSPVVLLGFDLLSLDDNGVHTVLERLSPLGVTEDRLLICCTHTHSAFGGIFSLENPNRDTMQSLFGKERQDLLDMLTMQAFYAVRQALSDMQEVSWATAKGTMENLLATNRHDPALPSDQEILIMEFLHADKRKVLLYNLSCHPTVLGSGNCRISADFVGGVRDLLRDQYDMVFFVNGSAGDMSTRFTRRESTFTECFRFAEIIRDKILHLRAAADFKPMPPVSLRYRSFFLKRSVCDSLDRAQEKYRAAEAALKKEKERTPDRAMLRKAESFLEGASINLLKAQHNRNNGASEDIVVKTGLLTIGQMKILCSPLELFSTLAIRLKSSVQTEVFGYVNALRGYLADKSSFDAGDYEALMGDFERGTGETYLALLRTWLSSPDADDDNTRRPLHP